MLLALAAEAAPIPDVERGLHDVPFDLSLAAEAGGALFYSTDLSDPSIPYTGPIAIDRTTIVRAVEVAADGTRSLVVTASYLFPADGPASGVLDPAEGSAHAVDDHEPHETPNPWGSEAPRVGKHGTRQGGGPEAPTSYSPTLGHVNAAYAGVPG